MKAVAILLFSGLVGAALGVLAATWPSDPASMTLECKVVGSKWHCEEV